MTFLDAIGAAKATYDLIEVAIKARDQAKLEMAMKALRDELMDASAMGLSQMEKLHGLELEAQKLRMKLADADRELENLKRQLEEKTKYEPFEIIRGAWAYTDISDVQKPVSLRPNLCGPCHNAGKKAVLQLLPAQTHGNTKWKCPNDPAHLLVDTSFTIDTTTGACIVVKRPGT